ncbi:hypothetical protein KIPB_002593 [Kipferlia bialata]|uniref:Uncharacterized protein n=1 Tax=Kipferlia bialata TaxID=797122 RepID=A0A9K3CSJ7_9EUKA|nr:hypothetical protein KIPB_002593 [Kipferlia bialata]|eukprot:g2593.t1
MSRFHSIYADRTSRSILDSALSETCFDAVAFETQFGGFGFGWLFMYLYTQEMQNDGPSMASHISVRAVVKGMFSIYRLHHARPFHNPVHSLDTLQTAILLCKAIQAASLFVSVLMGCKVPLGPKGAVKLARDLIVCTNNPGETRFQLRRLPATRFPIDRVRAQLILPSALSEPESDLGTRE